MILSQSHKAYKLVNSNPKRVQITIGNLTAANVDILQHEGYDIEDYEQGFRLKENGVLEVFDYTGEFYAMTDIDGTEIRLIEFEGVKKK